MNAIENFYKTATNEDWETMAALRKETGKDPPSSQTSKRTTASRLTASVPMS